jgi:TPR repeat protein
MSSISRPWRLVIAAFALSVGLPSCSPVADETAEPEYVETSVADAGNAAPSDDARSAYERRDVAALTALANQGLAIAQYNLGVMYGMAQDYAAAVSLFRKGAEQGLAMAQSNLGTMYEKGTGVAQDYAAAVS